MNVTLAEMIVVGASVAVFAFIPAVADLAAHWRRRPLRDDRDAGGPSEPLHEAVTMAERRVGVADANTDDVPADVAEPSQQVPTPEAASATAERPAHDPVSVAIAEEHPVAADEPLAWPASAGPSRTFRLEELRDAGALGRVAPLDGDAAARSALAGQRRALEQVVLEAPVEPLAYALCEARLTGGELRVRALVFDALWPEGPHDAVAEVRIVLDSKSEVVAAGTSPTTVRSS